MKLLGEAHPLSQGVQAGRKALRIRYINGMEMRKKRPRVCVGRGRRGSSEPPEPPYMFLPVKRIRLGEHTLIWQ